MLRAVIFDIDGTLINSVDYHAQAWQDAFAHFGKQIPFEDVRYQIGKGGDQLLPVFLSDEELDSFGKELEEWRGKHYKANYMHRVVAFPRVRELFERIRREGLTIGLASSAKGEELEYYISLTGAGPYIEGSTSADDVERSKPHPDIFEAALEKVQVQPAEAIVIGDTPYDAEAAGKVGIKTIGVLCGGFPEEDLRRSGCIAIYKNPTDLLNSYDQSPLAKMASPQS